MALGWVTGVYLSDESVNHGADCSMDLLVSALQRKKQQAAVPCIWHRQFAMQGHAGLVWAIVCRNMRATDVVRETHADATEQETCADNPM